MIAAGGKTRAAFERRCIPAEPRRFAPLIVAFRSEYTRYSSLTRLVSRAPHRSRRSREFHHRLLAACGKTRAAFERRCIPAKQPVGEPARRSAGDASRLNRVASRRSSLRVGRKSAAIPPSRALSAGRLPDLGAHAGSPTGCSPRRFAPLIVAFRSEYTRYSSLTRRPHRENWVSRAPRPHRETGRSRRSREFHHRLLAACGKTRAAFERRCIPAKQPVGEPARRSAGDASRLNRVASRRSSLRVGRKSAAIPPSRAAPTGRTGSAGRLAPTGRLADLGAHAGSPTGRSPRRFAPLIVAFRSEYTRYSSLTRRPHRENWVSRAPRPHRETGRSRRSREFHHRLPTARIRPGRAAPSGPSSDGSGAKR